MSVKNQNTISGNAKNFVGIFSDDYAFTIPLYQRPYSWTEENTEELIDDFLFHIEDVKDIDALDTSEPYFLGSVVLIKPQNSPASQVIDGQQRLTTMTILFSMLRYFADGDSDFFDTSQDAIMEKPSKFRKTKQRVRLEIRDQDNIFFETFIQQYDNDGISKLTNLDPSQLENDSQRRLHENALLLHEKLANLSKHKLEILLTFLLHHCYLVVIEVEEQDTAYRVFSVLNDRGLDLTASDILKADIIGKINEASRADYAKKWEKIEDQLGRDPFESLFGHIRMIRKRQKAKGTVLSELKTELENVKPEDFFAEIETYSNAYYSILYTSYEHSDKIKARELNAIFDQLLRIDNSNWLPPAIYFLSKYKNEPSTLLRFFTLLERLAASMTIRRITINPRIDHYGALIKEIEETGTDVFTSSSKLNLTTQEQADTVERLMDEIYTHQAAKYILLKLDRTMVSGEAQYDHKIISIEHVLPQNPEDNSTWKQDFNEKQHEYWVHRLANVVLLSNRKNSSVGRYDFVNKKEKYLADKGSPFLLTMSVQQETEWTIPVLKDRQQKLLDRLIVAWDLHSGKKRLEQEQDKQNEG